MTTEVYCKNCYEEDLLIELDNYEWSINGLIYKCPNCGDLYLCNNDTKELNLIKEYISFKNLKLVTV